MWAWLTPLLNLLLLGLNRFFEAKDQREEQAADPAHQIEEFQADAHAGNEAEVQDQVRRWRLARLLRRRDRDKRV